MSETKAITGFGTLLQRGNADGPPETFTVVGGIEDFDPPGLNRSRIEATHQESTNAMKEFIVGKLGEVEEFSVDIQYEPAGAGHNAATGLIADWKNRTKRNYRLVFPDDGATTWTFKALVAQFQPKAPMDGKLMATVTFRPTGDATLA